MQRPEILNLGLTISPGKYIIYCAIVSLIVRVVLCFYRGLLPLTTDEKGEENKESSFKKFGLIFVGFKRINKDDPGDQWLAFLIGFAEAASYPALILLGHFSIIGGWIVIKTAGSFRFWQESRPIFYRFLVGNLITLAFSYFWLVKFVCVLPKL